VLLAEYNVSHPSQFYGRSPSLNNSYPRKLTKQERSQATVEAILTATTHILTKEGYDQFNTNRVAELAGVSIGSLAAHAVNPDLHRVLTDYPQRADAPIGRDEDGRNVAIVSRKAVRSN
jgi:hypothetical protein